MPDGRGGDRVLGIVAGEDLPRMMAPAALSFVIAVASRPETKPLKTAEP
jgi:hypothetical protein